MLKRNGGQGREHTSDSIEAALNFAYAEYNDEMDELRGVMSHDAMVQKLWQEGQLQPGSRKSMRAERGVGVLPAGGGGGRGGGDRDGGGGGGGLMVGNGDVFGSGDGGGNT